MVVVDLLRAVLADLHEEGVELRHHERDPDSEACVRHYRAGVASMAWEIYEARRTRRQLWFDDASSDT